jgi:hypothetical protein
MLFDCKTEDFLLGINISNWKQEENKKGKK